MNATINQPNPLENKGLVPLKSATAWLGLRDTRVVLNLAREGKLTARRIGRRCYITTASLEKFAGVTE